MIRWTAVLAALVLLLTAWSALVPSGAAAQDNPAPVATASKGVSYATSLSVAQICVGGGVNVTFQWGGNDPYAVQQWIDLSLYDPTFAPGSFISAGPLPGFSNSYTWSGLLGGTMHLVRINQQLYNGAWDPGTFSFNTISCGGGGGLPPAPGPYAGAPASILSLSCTSSLATATLTNVGPASTQNVGLNAWANDRINCTATVSGTGQLTWRGPNSDIGYGTTFSTTVGGPRPGGAPYDISLQLDWGGNPAIAHVSVTPTVPNVVNPYNPYNPYQPYGTGCFMTQYGTACY